MDIKSTATSGDINAVLQQMRQIREQAQNTLKPLQIDKLDEMSRPRPRELTLAVLSNQPSTR